MRLRSIETAILYALGAVVWVLVTLALEIAALLWCAFTLEFVGAGQVGGGRIDTFITKVEVMRAHDWFVERSY